MRRGCTVVDLPSALHAIDEIVSNLLVLNVILSLLFRVAFART